MLKGKVWDSREPWSQGPSTVVPSEQSLASPASPGGRPGSQALFAGSRLGGPVACAGLGKPEGVWGPWSRLGLGRCG